MLSEKINLAIKVAAVAHRDQVRKGTNIPYISHPVAVAMVASKYTSDEDVVVASILHDVLEDVSSEIYSEADMIRDFGDKVVRIVRDVSENKTVDGVKKSWRERKNEYLAHIEGSVALEPLIVSTADKIHNLSDMLKEYQGKGEIFWQKFNATKEDEIWFYKRFLTIIQTKMIPEQMKLDLKELVERLIMIAA